MRKRCEQCGREWNAERSTARFCGSTCRGRAHRGETASPSVRVVAAGTAELAPPRVPGIGDPTPSLPGDLRRSVADRVWRDLEAAGMADSWQGAQALDLAVSIDAGGFSSGSSRAAVHRELRAIMADALRGVDAPGSAVGRYRDELAARRAKRAEGA